MPVLFLVKKATKFTKRALYKQVKNEVQDLDSQHAKGINKMDARMTLLVQLALCETYEKRG
jgi:hypothetical protein